MTGNNVLNRVTALLGYTDKNGQMSENNIIKSRLLDYINQITVDLDGTGDLKALYDIIKIKKECEEALIYGVAMLLALSVGDSEKNSIFANVYNFKRAAAKGNTVLKVDNMPDVVYGE